MKVSKLGFGAKIFLRVLFRPDDDAAPGNIETIDDHESTGAFALRDRIKGDQLPRLKDEIGDVMPSDFGLSEKRFGPLCGGRRSVDHLEDLMNPHRRGLSVDL